jgi:hypothetical protein
MPNNWTGIDFGILAHHEMVHVIDRLVNTEGPRPAMFVEGLAVYLSGGHYREGDPLQRAAALLALEMYLPLSQIVMISMLPSTRLVTCKPQPWLPTWISIWGWETFIDFTLTCRKGPATPTSSPAAFEDSLWPGPGRAGARFHHLP